jgi:DNA-binding SARP family transcriptional activator
LSKLRIHLLGLTRVEHDDQPIQFKRRKALALLAYLSATQSRHSRDFLATILWSDYETSRALAELRRILNALNKTPIGDWLDVDRKTVSLKRDDNLWIDVVHFYNLLENDPSPENLASVIDLYDGVFMRGFTISGGAEFDDWQSVQTRAFQQKFISALEQLVNHHVGNQDVDSAIGLLQRWLTEDPYYEIAQRQLMRCYAYTGQRAAALRQYEGFTTLIDAEFGDNPQDETTALYEAIKGNLSIPLAESPTVALGNMPPMPALVIGREHALNDIKRKLGVNAVSQSSSPLVIQGWPGIGKSTLVATLAHDPQIHRHFTDGVLWASLGETPNLFSELINWAHALNFSDTSDANTVTDLSARMTALLRDKRMLLIIDDIWESAHAMPFSIGGQHCATIFTTRMNNVAQSLAVAADDIYKLPILSEEKSIELIETLAPEAVSQHLDETRELVRDLEGLPLALQVAGRLLRVEMNLGWGVSDLLAELREGARLLQAQAPADRREHDAIPTVAALLQKSVNLLDDDSRERFAWLGVFAPKPATFDLDAMKAVWMADNPRDTVRTLVERGLL